jgi:hypothetical protein
MKNISIPEPCHENWADFTPTEKGAFCGSCQIDVVDFSNKSSNEIKTILKENAGKSVCGRFKKSQLDDLNDDFFAWENQSAKSFQSKFLYACMIVFGMTLFTSCTIESGLNFSNDGIALFDNSTSQLNIFNPPMEGDTTKKPIENRHIKGKVAYQEYETQPVIETIPDSNKVINEEVEIFTLGEIAYSAEEEIEDTLQCGTNILIEQEDTLYDDMMVDGEIRWTEEFTQFTADTTKASIIPYNVNHGVKKDLVINESIFSSSLYPNPSSGISTIVLQVHQELIFDIYLYAIDGKKVKSIHNGLINVGRNEFQIDLSSYNTGSYLIIINTKYQKRSLRIEKVD